MKHINYPIGINAEISNGIIYIHDLVPIKNNEQKLILFYKEKEEDKYLKKAVI